MSWLKQFSKRWAVVLAMGALIATTGSAYALFSSTISLGGVNVTVGSSVLQAQLPDGTWISDRWTDGMDITGLYPGLSASANFNLKNSSTAPIKLKVSARLVSADGDWDALKDVIEVRVHPLGNTSSSTGYKTLAEWNAEGGINLPGGDIEQGTTKAYTADVQIDKKYGNEVAGKKLTNVQVLVTSIQD
jgi:hypothetical protein